MDIFPVQAEPAPVFAPILSEVRQRLPQGLQMRLPATLPDRPEPLYAFVRSSQQGLFVYLATEAGCNQPSCSVGGAAVLTEAGFASWERKLADATPIELPNGIQGHYLQQGKGEEADRYIIWQQEGSNYVLGADNRNVSEQELVQIAASMVSEPAIR
jgi:phage tail protein X